MSKTVLEQALEHLLNKEEDKAAGLLHDYYVGIGRKVYEDIMADDVNLEDEQALEDVTDAVEEVDADLTEEGDDEVLDPTMDPEAAATDDVAGDMGAEPSAEPVAGDAADVADAMVDVESALAKLKAEFEEMVSGEDVDGDAEAGEMGAEEMPEEPKESIEESAELEKVSSPDNGDKADEKNSPVAKRNPMMARPATKFGGGSEAGGTAPKAQDLGGTTKPALSKVATPKG
jgi:hypothetical protein